MVVLVVEVVEEVLGTVVVPVVVVVEEVLGVVVDVVVLDDVVEDVLPPAAFTMTVPFIHPW